MRLQDFLLELSRAAVSLALSVWIGGTLVAFLAARGLFATLPRETAGEIFASIVRAFDRVKFIAAGGLLVGVLLEVQIAGSALPARHVVRAAILCLLIAAHVYVVMVVQPKMRYYQEKMPKAPAADEDDPWRAKFRREHRKSEAVGGVGLVLAVSALVVG